MIPLLNRINSSFLEWNLQKATSRLGFRSSTIFALKHFGSFLFVGKGKDFHMSMYLDFEWRFMVYIYNLSHAKYFCYCSWKKIPRFYDAYGTLKLFHSRSWSRPSSPSKPSGRSQSWTNFSGSPAHQQGPSLAWGSLRVGRWLSAGASTWTSRRR